MTFLWLGFGGPSADTMSDRHRCYTKYKVIIMNINDKSVFQPAF